MRRVCAWLAVCTAIVCASAQAAEKSDSKSPPKLQKVTVKTIDDEQFEAPTAELRDGSLVLELKPEKAIPLNEIDRVVFSTKTNLTAEWVGQDNHDFVQIGVIEGGNGIQDVHVRLKGISNQQQIKQLRVVCPSPPRAWRLNPAESPDWLLSQQRAGSSGDVDLYFEPPSEDLFDHELQITATFADGSTAKAMLNVTSYTSDAAKVEAKTEAPMTQTTAKGPTAAIDLEGTDRLHGTLSDFGEEQLTVRTSWKAELKIPLLQARGILFDQASAEGKTRYEQALPKPESDDRIVLLAKDGKLAEITGRVKQLSEKQLVVSYQNEERKVDLDRVQAIVFAAHPPVRSRGTTPQVVHFANGDTLSGVWQGFKEGQIVFQIPWKETLEVPIVEVAKIGGSDGRMVQLSDLEPLSAEQTPFFTRPTPYSRDQAIGGGPLKLGDKTFAKGLAVHSRTVLVYSLEGQYSEFRTTVGFDPAAGPRGRVVCRVLADSEELFAKKDMRSTDSPETLNLKVDGAKQLTLEVDFGEDEDVQDRVIWGAPRLVRK